MPRAGVDATQAAGNLIPFEYFVRIDLPGGTIRYTTFGRDVTLDIDGSPQLWSAYQMQVASLSQTSESPLDVSYLSIGNLDQAWNLSAFGSDQFREIAAYVFLAQFDPAVFPGTLTVLGKPKMFAGRTAGADQGADGWLKVTLNPYGASWNALTLTVINPNCRYFYKDAETCQYVGGLPTCLRTRSDCSVHGNLIHFGGADWMPQIDISLQWGSIAVAPTANPLGPLPNTIAVPPPSLLGVPRMPVIPRAPRGSGGPPVVGAR